jgi:hypothetical protein
MPLEAPETQINESLIRPDYRGPGTAAGGPGVVVHPVGNRSGMRVLPALAVTAALGAMLAGGCSASSDKVSSDVGVSACNADPAGGNPTAEGTIVNHTSKPSAYAFRVSFADSAGNESSQGAVAVARVEPGATAKWTSHGATGAKGPLTCKVTNLARTAVGG